MNIFSVKDTRGRESTTLFFCSLSWLAILIKFIFASTKAFGIEWPAVTLTEFGGATALILAIWLGREWTEKKTQQENPQ